ncbi:MAG: hypothetical protein ONB27_06705 [candidate division KSB1 bacterium]|nr:hypothetical protein [candidate division KSB1 bacterium]
MKTISAETIDQAWRDLAVMLPGTFTNVVGDFAQEQPFILSYLMAVDEEQLNEDERELLVFLGTIIWRIMSQGDVPLAKATAEKIFAAEDNNVNMFRNFQGKDQSDYYEAITNMLQSYNQTELLNFVISVLTEEDEESNVREDNLGMMMIYLKTVIDCLDK